MKSGIRSVARVISVTCADVREAAASFLRCLICALLVPIVIARFHSANGAVGDLAPPEIQLPALLTCIALTIAACLLPFLDRRFMARLYVRLRRHFFHRL